MKRILTCRQMQQLDILTQEKFYVPSLVLMERAALAVVDVVMEHNPENGKVAVLAGSGNNGGDGMAVARILHTKGLPVQVCMLGRTENMSASFKAQYQAVKAYGIPLVESVEDIEDAAVYVDSIFGIGLSRDLNFDLQEAVKIINDRPGFKLAIDIPSGIGGDDGQIYGQAIRCDATVTFNYTKPGHYLEEGGHYCGDVICCDVGITEHGIEEGTKTLLAMTEDDLRLIPDRKGNGNKGTFGKVLVIAGSENICGAAILSAKAALKMGCGMVKVFTHVNNRIPLQAAFPEALVATYDSKPDLDGLVKDMQWADVILMGPGMGTDAVAKKILNHVWQNCATPMVLDADALNIIAEDTSILLKPHTELILTPHVAEMARLTGDSVSYISQHLIDSAEEFARQYQVTCVLKDARTVTSIPYADTYLNLSGNDGMATAGSGDVLSGIIAGLIAQGMKPDLAAPFGVYFHGLCGNYAAKEYSKYNMTATDLIDMIAEILK